MKVLTILGTRPEIIRLSRVIEKLDALCEHRLVHTGQNFDPSLSDLFFNELGVRKPDYHLGVTGAGFARQVAEMLPAADDVMEAERPDAVLILGDTNSGLCAILAQRRRIPVYHMEAGNRCYDDRVPEEVNRRIIDHSSDVLMPYTERSRQNLLSEGIPGERIYVTGNPIKEVIDHYDARIRSSAVLSRLGLSDGRFFLVTMHRQENVDVRDRLENIAAALVRLNTDYGYTVLVSTHPRTRKRMEEYGVSVASGADIRFLEPFGFFDFITLERNAFCVISDSGTVQEECAIFGVPNVTIRDTTERPETLECGSNLLTGVEMDRVVRGVQTVTRLRGAWIPPRDYLVPNVSDIVVRLLMTFRRPA